MLGETRIRGDEGENAALYIVCRCWEKEDEMDSKHRLAREVGPRHRSTIVIARWG
jgi:hypothetical protein